MSLISDWFEPRRRATVQSLFTMGIPLGAAAAFFLGGAIGAEWGWRVAFYLLGFPGLILAGIMLLIPEPVRGATENKPVQAVEANPLSLDLKLLFAKPALRYHLFGYAGLAVASNALSMWVPSLMVRGYSAPLAQVGLVSALSWAISGGLSTGFGGAIADKFREKSPGGRMRFTSLAALATAGFWAFLLFSGNLNLMYGGLFVLAGLGLIWLGPAAADVHEMVGPKLRGLGIAIYYLVVNVIGYGLAPPLIGKISDYLGSASDPHQLRYALLICPIACLLGAFSLWQGSRLMAQTGSRG